ncbi:hypothetical protein TSUD_119320 [Trifolium subterraneum]|uniref:Uncharacterized protein n=1 Tax=Trifolium subterraneum TaxID=3900 RepID=A0A2Z6NNW9_TRISU|nr:hypothetical protein TSUD_119320 [Trifolium subterraneum]
MSHNENYNPLPSSVDSKLQAICESLPISQKQGKQGNNEKLCSSVAEDVKLVVCVTAKPKDELVFHKFEDFKVENEKTMISSMSDECSTCLSSPESGVTFLDFSDSSR